MNELQDDILQLLKLLERNQALEHLVLIGSWATVFYQEYFGGGDYHPVIRTTDIDFLIPKTPPRDTKIHIGKIMVADGFLEDVRIDGWVTYHKPEFHVEFLLSRVGPRPDDAITIPQLGITARPLRHMWLLTQFVIQASYQGIPLNLPHPGAYALHKLIISTKRRDKEKQAKDREQASAVLLALSDEDRALTKDILQKLSKNERKAVLEAVEHELLIRDVFK